MRQIMHYDAEFRREESTSAAGSQAKHWTAVRGDLSTGPFLTPPPTWTRGWPLVVQIGAGQSAFGAAPIRRVSPRTSIFQNDAIAACSF